LHLAKLKKGKKKKIKSEEEITFVGVHCRRTDHLEYESRHKQPALKTTYFLEAMHLFRQKLGKQVAFVVVSDDMQWVKSALLPRVSQRDLYLAGREATPGEDLATLAACNHTIQSYGSFSYFAGVLADGHRVIPEHFKAYRGASTGASATLDDNPAEVKLRPRLYFLSELKDSKRGKEEL